MAKEHLLGLEAERLFVLEQCTLAEIASRLKVSERTLQTWKARSDWDSKKRAYLASRQSFHEELYEFARELLVDIRTAMKEGKDVSTGKLYTLGRLIPNLVKARDYESAAAKQGEAEDKKGITPEVIKLIEEQVLGIRR